MVCCLGLLLRGEVRAKTDRKRLKMSLLEKAEWCWEDLKITTENLDGTFRVFRDAAKTNKIRMTMTAYDAQLAADELDAYLPTPKLLDARYAAA